MRAKEFMSYCPHCGSNSFKGVSDKEMHCEECGFRFFPNAAAAVALIIENENGEIMLTRRAIAPNKGALDLPGGFVDPDESAEEAIRREVAEELNAEVTSMKYLTSAPNAYLFSGYTVMTCDMGFSVTLQKYNALSAQDDISAIEWYSRDNIVDAIKEIASPSIKKIIEFYLDNR